LTVAVAVMPRFRRVPLSWWVPQEDRLALAILSVVFWGSSLLHAAQAGSKGASVLAMFGMGLIYLVFTIWNLAGALRGALAQYEAGEIPERQPRSLWQLFLVLGGMLGANTAILVIYMVRGATLTPVDAVSVVISALILAAIAAHSGARKLYSHPLGRGWVAIAGKTVPQLVMTGLFVVRPAAAGAFTIVMLLGIDGLAGLRLMPTLRAWRRNRGSKHLLGLMLGEGGNAFSAALLTLVWLVVSIF
jgi:hypothetical protein